MIPNADQNTAIVPSDLEHREIPNPEKTEFERNEIPPENSPDDSVDDSEHLEGDEEDSGVE